MYNPFKYTGEYTDAESGFVYLRARYYDPESQQFLTVDPALAWTEEAYAYVGGSPTNFRDPLGLYDYEYNWEIGNVQDGVTAVKAMAYLQQHPAAIFPFGIRGTQGETSIQKGSIYDLSVVTVFDAGIWNEVQVTDVSDTSFTFTSKGGLDPPSSTITFRTYEKNCKVYLQQEAHTPSLGLIDSFVKSMARVTWQQQSENLSRIFYPPIDPPWWIKLILAQNFIDPLPGVGIPLPGTTRP